MYVASVEAVTTVQCGAISAHDRREQSTNIIYLNAANAYNHKRSRSTYTHIHYT